MYELIKIILLFVAITGAIYCSASRNDISEDTQENSKSLPALGKSLAPETVQVKVILVEYQDREKYYACMIKLEKILAYGPATPPLAEGSELEVEIAKDLIKDNFTSLETMLESDRLLTMILRKKKAGMGVAVKEKKEWDVIKIE